jgi:lipid-A-disaccharide synthase
LSEDYPNLRAQIPVPDERLRKLVGSIVGRCPCADRVEVVEATEGLSARAALMSSGTMSFACALAGLPGVIAYKAHPITYWIGKCLVKIPHLGMANVLLPENPPYREFLQGAANGRNLSSELAQIIDQPNARTDAIEVSGKLKDILTQEEGRGAVDWLIEAGSLE